MDTQRFLNIHTVKNGEFSNDTGMATTVSHVAAYGFETVLEVNIGDCRSIAKCLTADFLNQYLENRPVFGVDPNGKLHFIRITPSNKQLRDQIFVEQYAQLLKK